jgi:hypothetical protein
MWHFTAAVVAALAGSSCLGWLVGYATGVGPLGTLAGVVCAAWCVGTVRQDWDPTAQDRQEAADLAHLAGR